ncbi:MAG: SRPBCC domain-containing protein, partial [Chloroflexi bacterium]|nr:SRPBCC domain-containing protein [Chloroflexota bacterium]
MAMWTFEEPQEEAQARVEVELSAEPAAVFAALTDAALLSRWLGPSAEVDLREGGKYTFVFEDGLEVSGVYVIVERGVSFLAS